MGVRPSAIAIAVLALAGCGADDPSDSSGPIEIVDVIDDVAYHPACSNEPVDVEGAIWYPVPEWGNDDFAELYAEITGPAREEPVDIRGFAPRIVPPGPGDDIGTLVVYADGYARFESDSGLVQWLTSEEQTYDWVC